MVSAKLYYVFPSAQLIHLPLRLTAGILPTDLIPNEMILFNPDSGQPATASDCMAFFCCWSLGNTELIVTQSDW